jgi:DNA-binding transcriptional regulator YdaS (Cro superfamily)
MDEALQEAVKAAGGVRALGRMLGTSHTAIMRWDQVPALRVLEVERLTGVSKERLRPDLYRPDMTLVDTDTGLVTMIDTKMFRRRKREPTPAAIRQAVESAVHELAREFADRLTELIFEELRRPPDNVEDAEEESPTP